MDRLYADIGARMRSIRKTLKLTQSEVAAAVGIDPSFYKGPADQRPSYQEGSCPLVEEYCDHRNIEIKTFFPNTEEEMDDVARAVIKVIEHIDELK